MSSLNEQFLLFRIHHFRDAQAFETVYESYADRLQRFLLGKLPTSQDANDALSTVFLRAWTYMTSTKVDHISGLLHTIARGVVAEFYRSRKKTVPLDSNESLADTLSDQGKGEQHIQAGAEVTLIQRSLNKLTEEQSLAITLRYVSELPVAQIAEQLGKSLNATHVLLHRAMKVLRKDLDVNQEKPL